MQLRLNTFTLDDLKQKRCFIGFDAFVDHITKPIAEKDDKTNQHFKSLEEYAHYLLDRKESSFSLEMEIPETKIGGNNPIISDILSGFGVQVITAGAYGKPDIDPLFVPLSKKTRLISFSNPGKCTSFEFTYNKLMSYYNMDPKDFTYDNLINYLPEDELVDIMDNTDIIIFVNVCEQLAVMNILEAIADRVLPKSTGTRRFFIDLSNCGQLSYNELQRVVEFLKKLGNFGKVILSTNENEFQTLFNFYGKNTYNKSNLKDAVRFVRKELGIDTLILRTLEWFYCNSPGIEQQAENIIVENPRYLTGVGDAQNSGICLGLLLSLPVNEVLYAGVRAGNCYLQNGEVSSQYFENLFQTNLSYKENNDEAP
ncbi:hypothetical protein FACS189485_04870 [Spirochaetia bacterium]|nr:hypothetical protein FACS189485_04870 [Spirochaetia bacterium]